MELLGIVVVVVVVVVCCFGEVAAPWRNSYDFPRSSRCSQAFGLDCGLELGLDFDLDFGFWPDSGLDLDLDLARFSAGFGWILVWIWLDSAGFRVDYRSNSSHDSPGGPRKS